MALHVYRPYKRRQNVQVEPRAAAEWSHYKVLTSISVEVSRKSRVAERENKWRHHHIIFMVCSLIEHSSQPISARESAQLL